jgi:hypothetical protein
VDEQGLTGLTPFSAVSVINYHYCHFATKAVHICRTSDHFSPIRYRPHLRPGLSYVTHFFPSQNRFCFLHKYKRNLKSSPEIAEGQVTMGFTGSRAITSVQPPAAEIHVTEWNVSPNSFDPKRWSPVLVCLALVALVMARVGWLPISFLREDSMLGDEYPLINRLMSEDVSPDERQRLIAQLEALPVHFYHFHSRWMLINNVTAFESWDGKGFHPERCRWPRDIQLLWATAYGKSDIENGGFHQFFGNGTGTFAPEIQECFRRMELHETADIVQRAMLVFGQPYPRSREARQQFLDRFPGERREEFDPFHALDDPFYASLKAGPLSFSERADKWLRDQCGIQHLSD